MDQMDQIHSAVTALSADVKDSQIETAERLARIETKMDNDYQLHGRVRKLEMWRSWMAGIGAVCILALPFLTKWLFNLASK